MRISVFGISYPTQTEDPDYCELIVDGELIGSIHIRKLDQFIDDFWDGALELVDVNGRDHIYRTLGKQ